MFKMEEFEFQKTLVAFLFLHCSLCYISRYLSAREILPFALFNCLLSFTLGTFCTLNEPLSNQLSNLCYKVSAKTNTLSLSNSLFIICIEHSAVVSLSTHCFSLKSPQLFVHLSVFLTLDKLSTDMSRTDC